MNKLAKNAYCSATFFFSMSSVVLSYGQSASASQPTSVYNNSGYNVQNPNNNFSPNVSVSFMNLVEVATVVSTKIQTLIKDVVVDQDYRGMYNQLKKTLWEKRYKIGLYGAGGLYGVLFSYLLLEYNLFINSGKLWVHWKSDYSFGQLCELSQEQLSHELILAIQAHNIDPKNPTNCAQPLITFIYSIDSEIKRIERYLSIAKAVEFMRLGVIFPVNAKKMTRAQLLLERGQFVRHIFLSWLAEYNMAALKKDISAENKKGIEV